MGSRLGSHLGRSRWLLGAVALLVLAAAGGLLAWRFWPAPEPDDADLVVFDWFNNLPQSVLDDFARTHNITLRRVFHNEPAEGARVLEQAPPYDVAMIEYPYIRPLAEAGKLLPLDLRRIPNFRYVDPGFRNLVFDPANRYSVPYSWSAMGIVALDGIFPAGEVRWADLWDVDLGGGKLVLWSGWSRHLIAATLRRLGYSANSENPVELAAARTELLRLRPRVLIFATSSYQAYVQPALQGQIRATVADMAAYNTMRAFGLPVRFYYPAEGALVWGDSLAIPVNCRHPELAAELINYLLDPQVAAKVMAANHLRSTNEAALQYAPPAVRDDPEFVPDLDTLRKAELVLPLSPAGQAAWDALWADFVKGEE